MTRGRHLQVNFLSYVQLTSLALPSLTDSKGSLVVVSSLLGACTRGGESGGHRARCGRAPGQEGPLAEGERRWSLSCCPPALLGQVPTSFSRPYSAAKFALDGFFGSLRRELDVQDVNVAITMCVLGLRDRASPAEGVR